MTSNRLLIGAHAERREALLASAVVLIGVLAAIALVDPLREFMTQDDGWAYARSVRHLLETGRYRLDAWAAANMPVQVYLAGALAEIFGYSLSLLRLQTLVLLLAGVLAFYALLCELRLRPLAAALLALVLLACPLVLMLAFTFMSDVQFMSWMVLATWLYVRGLRRDSDAAVLLGSVMAACAIGTRQFGMAIIGAWVAVWCVAAPPRPSARRMLCAIGLPIVMSAWQLAAGFDAPSFTQAVRLHEQADFWRQPPWYLARELAWRLATLLQYLGLLMLPLLPIMAALAVRARRGPSVSGAATAFWRSGSRMALAAATFAAVVVLWLLQSPITTRPGGDLWLPLWWMLPNAFGDHLWITRGLTFAGLVGALLLIVLALQQWPPGTRWRGLSPAWLLCTALGVCMVALHVAYLQLNDTYLVGLLPLALLLPARALREAKTLSTRWLAVSMVLCFLVIVPLAVWMRGEFDVLELQWRASAKLVAKGVDPRCIASARPWAEYHGGFDDWLAATYPGFDGKRGDVSPAEVGRSIHDDYWQWIAQRGRVVRYVVSSPWPDSRGGWRVVDQVVYRNPFSKHQTIVTYARMGDGSSGGASCPASDSVSTPLPPSSR